MNLLICLPIIRSPSFTSFNLIRLDLDIGLLRRLQRQMLSGKFKAACVTCPNFDITYLNPRYSVGVATGLHGYQGGASSAYFSLSLSSLRSSLRSSLSLIRLFVLLNLTSS